jgi:hypothetical protein
MRFTGSGFRLGFHGLCFDIHLLPKVGAAWMPKGSQAEVMTPGQNDALLTRFCIFGSHKLILLRIKMAIAP